MTTLLRYTHLVVLGLILGGSPLIAMETVELGERGKTTQSTITTALLPDEPSTPQRCCHSSPVESWAPLLNRDLTVAAGVAAPLVASFVGGLPSIVLNSACITLAPFNAFVTYRMEEWLNAQGIDLGEGACLSDYTVEFFGSYLRPFTRMSLAQNLLYSGWMGLAILCASIDYGNGGHVAAHNSNIFVTTLSSVLSVSGTLTTFAYLYK